MVFLALFLSVSVFCFNALYMAYEYISEMVFLDVCGFRSKLMCNILQEKNVKIVLFLQTTQPTCCWLYIFPFITIIFLLLLNVDRRHQNMFSKFHSIPHPFFVYFAFSSYYFIFI